MQQPGRNLVHGVVIARCGRIAIECESNGGRIAVDSNHSCNHHITVEATEQNNKHRVIRDIRNEHRLPEKLNSQKIKKWKSQSNITYMQNILLA